MRASYKRAVEWIAMNDEGMETDVGVVSMLASVAMVADLWGKDEVTVAKAILRLRKKWRDDAPDAVADPAGGFVSNY